MRSTKLLSIIEACQGLEQFTRKEIDEITGLSSKMVSPTLSYLKKQGYLEVISQAGETPPIYKWIGQRPPKTDAEIEKIANSWKPRGITTPAFQAPPEFTDLNSALEWLFEYIEKLESENQALYQQLSKCSHYGARAEAIRQRYEDRLHAYLEKQKSRNGLEEKKE